jgi:hypothetical protein
MPTNDISAEEIRGALSRLLSAQGLRVSDRNKRFLRYVVEEFLAGRGGRIKSYSIALDVFGRPANFDGAKDTIVRTEATRLRAALAQFYTEAGVGEPLRISIPPGGYVPRFERVQARTLELMPLPAPISRKEPPPEAPRAPPALAARIQIRLSAYVGQGRRLVSLVREAAAAFAAAPKPPMNRRVPQTFKSTVGARLSQF